MLQGSYSCNDVGSLCSLLPCICSLEVVSEQKIRSAHFVQQKSNGLRRDVIKILQDLYYNYYLQSITGDEEGRGL